MVDVVFSLADTLTICQRRAIGSKAIQSKPLRCMRRRDDGAGYSIEKYTDQEYLAISYTWPAQGWRRLHNSNKPTAIFRLGTEGSRPCAHFSVFASKAVEAIQPDCAVWLDFECINQADTHEKALQVPVMDKIYNKAKVTIILLEDVEMSTAELDLLSSASFARVQEHFQDYTLIVRRILGARWFSRAWCSQELILSRWPTIFVHRSDDPLGSPIHFSVTTLKHWMERAAMRDRSIDQQKLSDPRGFNPMVTRAGYFGNAMAWAFGVVYPMGCYNHYDKIALVDNLIQADISSRIVILSATDKSDNKIVGENVVKIVNALAIMRGDYSLLLNSHVIDNPLQAAKGFGWGGTSIKGDMISETWTPRVYKVEAGNPLLDASGLMLKGLATKVQEQEDWTFWREERSLDVLQVSIEGKQYHIASNWLSEHYPTSVESPLKPDQALFRDLCYVLEYFNAVDLYKIIFEAAKPEEWYYDESCGDLKTLMLRRFSGYSPTIKFFAGGLLFMQAGGKCGFSRLTLAGNLQLFVKGNVSNLRGKTLFQPYVLRPKEFTTIVPTVNSYILSDGAIVRGEMTYRCLGGVRGFGLIPEDVGEIEVRIY